MNKTLAIRIVLYLVAISLVSMFLWALLKYKEDRHAIATLPAIESETLWGDYFDSSRTLNNRMRTAILFFHPECEFCTVELNGIIKRHNECRDVFWVFVTLANPNEIQELLIDCPIDAISNSVILYEDTPKLHSLFDVKGPPALFIYDDDNRLIKEYRGAISIDTIITDLK